MRRDPGDVRCNTALGRLLLRRGRLAEAERRLRAALATQARYGSPAGDGEPSYQLGLCLRERDRPAEAGAALLAAARDERWREPALVQLAQLDAARGDLRPALEHAERSLVRTPSRARAAHLRLILLRRTGRRGEALRAAEEALRADPLDFGARNERRLLLEQECRRREAAAERAELEALMAGDGAARLELAGDYAAAGAYDEAFDLLAPLASRPPRAGRKRAAPSHDPAARSLVLYHMAHYARLAGDTGAASSHVHAAAALPPPRRFPAAESLAALQSALAVSPRNGHAACALGAYWYGQGDLGAARAWWEKSRRWSPEQPAAHRGMALVELREGSGVGEALRCLERALRLDPGDPRLVLEVDHLRRRLGASPERRLSFLSANRRLASMHEDLAIELMTLLNTVGRHQQALALAEARRAGGWSPGLVRLVEQQVVALVELARRRARASRLVRALDLLDRARSCTDGLAHGHGGYRVRIAYWHGVVLDRRGDVRRALESWSEAAAEPLHGALSAPRPATAEATFYLGLCLERLGDSAAARARFASLLDGQEREPSEEDRDILPGSGVADEAFPADRAADRRFASALGCWGLGRHAEARRHLRRVLAMDKSHQSARLHLQWLGAEILSRRQQ